MKSKGYTVTGLVNGKRKYFSNGEVNIAVGTKKEARFLRNIVERRKRELIKRREPIRTTRVRIIGI